MPPIVPPTTQKDTTQSLHTKKKKNRKNRESLDVTKKILFAEEAEAEDDFEGNDDEDDDAEMPNYPPGTIVGGQVVGPHGYLEDGFVTSTVRVCRVKDKKVVKMSQDILTHISRTAIEDFKRNKASERLINYKMYETSSKFYYNNYIQKCKDLYHELSLEFWEEQYSSLQLPHKLNQKYPGEWTRLMKAWNHEIDNIPQSNSLTCYARLQKLNGNAPKSYLICFLDGEKQSLIGWVLLNAKPGTQLNALTIDSFDVCNFKAALLMLSGLQHCYTVEEHSIMFDYSYSDYEKGAMGDEEKRKRDILLSLGFIIEKGKDLFYKLDPKPKKFEMTQDHHKALEPNLNSRVKNNPDVLDGIIEKRDLSKVPDSLSSFVMDYNSDEESVYSDNAVQEIEDAWNASDNLEKNDDDSNEVGELMTSSSKAEANQHSQLSSQLSSSLMSPNKSMEEGDRNSQLASSLMSPSKSITSSMTSPISTPTSEKKRKKIRKKKRKKNKNKNKKSDTEGESQKGESLIERDDEQSSSTQPAQKKLRTIFNDPGDGHASNSTVAKSRTLFSYFKRSSSPTATVTPTAGNALIPDDDGYHNGSGPLLTNDVIDLENMEEAFMQEYFAIHSSTQGNVHLAVSSAPLHLSPLQQWEFRMRPLSTSDREQYDKAVAEPRDDTLLITLYAIPMTRYKISCLRNRVWLNDEVINFYLKLLKTRDDALCMKISGKKPSWYFNSFFMEKLMIVDKRYKYENVARFVCELLLRLAFYDESILISLGGLRNLTYLKWISYFFP